MKENIMLEFQPFSIETLKQIKPYIDMNTAHNSDLSMGFIFMWHKKDSRFCICNDTLVIQQKLGDHTLFTWPVGKDVDGMIDKLQIYARENKLPMRFYPVVEENIQLLRSDKRLSPVLGTYDRNWSDYIYSFAETMEFKGRKFSGQRNHINKFKRLYGEPAIRFITPDDMPLVRDLLAKYEESHSGGRMEQLEQKHTREILEIYSELGLYAACMTVNDEMIAFTIGEIVGDMLIIHVEKALTKYQGVYPTMYNGFVRLIAEHLGHPLSLINREDDSGDMGLRTSKMQYQPTGLINKYMVNTNSPVGKVPENTVIKGDNVVLSRIFETDKNAYMKLNTDIENNRYWGYDYRKDPSIVGDITEDTFYDSVKYDMLVGDSINFAVREHENGDMAGEGILWNFTHDGSCEVGLRLLPEYQGKGMGKNAFGALCDYAEEKLGLKVWARSHKENGASIRMISANGFKETCEKNNFIYFER